MKTNQSTRCLLAVSWALILLALFVGLAGTVVADPGATTVVVTNTGDSGPGSLRQALLDVEAGGTIRFDPSLAGGTIVLTSGQLVISQSLTIDASAALSLTVDGNSTDRVFTVGEGAAVELIDLTITGGKAPVNQEDTIPHGGGILNLGDLIVTRCNVVENQAGYGQSAQPPCPFAPAMPGGDGGGIFNAGRLILYETTVISNTAGGGGSGLGQSCQPAPGALGGNGGGIFSSGALEIANSAVWANRAGDGGRGFGPYAPPGEGGHGGGLYNTGGMTVTNTLILNNAAGQGHYYYSVPYQNIAGSSGGDGGGIYSAPPGRLALADSIVQGNIGGSGQSGGVGGGLYTSGMAWITNSAFVSNRAANCQSSGGSGGAIANHGTLVLQGSLLDANSSGTSVDGGSGGDGGGLWNRGVAHVLDSAITNNRSGRGSEGILCVGIRCGGTPGGPGGDGAGLWSNSTLVLLRVTVDGNQAGAGGLGGSDPRGSPHIYGLSGGAGGSGGGLWNSGLVVALQTTFSRNRAGAAGAGRSAEVEGSAGGQGGNGGGLDNHGIAALINTTVSGNSTGYGGDGGSATITDPHTCLGFPCRSGDGGDGGSGGGVHNRYSLTLDNCTLTANSAAAAGVAGQESLVAGSDGSAGAGGGIHGALAARDTILAGNSSAGGGIDCAGQLSAGSHNLIEDPDGCEIDPAVGNNVTGSRPALIPLALNAPGTTETHALAWGSPAIHAGGCSGATVAHDQRGVPRPQGAACDIGAYEYEPDRWRLLWLPLLRVE